MAHGRTWRCPLGPNLELETEKEQHSGLLSPQHLSSVKEECDHE